MVSAPKERNNLYPTIEKEKRDWYSENRAAWVILVDYISDEEDNENGLNAQGTMGPSSMLPPSEWINNITPFRLYDDDDILYFEGILNNDPDCASQTAALEWGGSFAGCSIIRVHRCGKWVQEIC